MEQVTLGQLKVEGLSYYRIEKIYIETKAGKHGICDLQVIAAPVHISSDKCVNIEAKESIHITAGKQILLQSGTSHVKLTEKQITFGGESVIVGE